MLYVEIPLRFIRPAINPQSLGTGDKLICQRMAIPFADTYSRHKTPMTYVHITITRKDDRFRTKWVLMSFCIWQYKGITLLCMHIIAAHENWYGSCHYFIQLTVTLPMQNWCDHCCRTAYNFQNDLRYPKIYIDASKFKEFWCNKNLLLV